MNRSRIIVVCFCSLLLSACQQESVDTQMPDLVSVPEQNGTPLRTRLLTAEQFTNSIEQVFGSDVSDSILAPIPPMDRTSGLLASGAAFVGVTSDQISQIQLSAAAIAEKVVDEEHRDFLIPCRPESLESADTACAQLFLAEAGRLLIRKPVDELRLSELVSLAGFAADEMEDFYDGLALALESLLISPEFVFIVEEAEADPVNSGQQRLDSYSLASRLSFFLWNAPPDSELLDAAESGALYTEDGLVGAVERMLLSPRIEDGMRAFFDDMLAFDEFNSLAKDPNVYPSVTGTTLQHAREQTLLTMVDHLLRQDADYRDLFTTKKTFMSMQLAPVYGVPTSQGWVPYEFAEDSPRMGLLTHVSFLAANSHAVRSSPTIRGRALRERFLCQLVPDPPPDVDFSALEEAEGALTARERLTVHQTNPSCAGCHRVMDPIGLALENFDGAGIYRDTENGVELDVSGELDGVTFDDISGLAVAMHGHPALPSCLVNRLYAYGTGGPTDRLLDRDNLQWFEDRFVENGHRLRGLLKDLVTSPAFRTVRSEAEPDNASIVEPDRAADTHSLAAAGNVTARMESAR